MNAFHGDRLGDGWIYLVEARVSWTLAAAGVLTLFFAFALVSLRFENEPGKLDIPADDQVRLERTDFESRFGGGELVMAAIRFDRRIDADAVRLIDSMTKKVAAVEGIQSVYSLTTATEFDWVSSMGIQVLRPIVLIPALDRITDSSVAGTIDRLASSDIYAGTIISRDCRALAMAISMVADSSNGQRRDIYHVLDQVRNALSPPEGTEVNVMLAGTPIINAAMKRTMRGDLLIFGPLSLVAFVLVLTLIFRSLRLVLIGLTAALVSLVWSLGMLPLTGSSMSIGLSMMVPLILAFSLMQSVHHLAAAKSGMKARWNDVVVPNMLCGATTAIGFLSLASSRLAGIREVGLYIGMGVIMTTVVVNVLVPSLLHLRPAQTGPSREGRRTDLIERVVFGLQRLMLDHPRRHLSLWLVAAVIAVAGIRHLRVESNHLEYLNRDSQFISSFYYVDSTFGGILPLEIVVDLPVNEAGSLVGRLSELEESLRGIVGMGSVISAVDFIEQAERNKPDRPVPLRPPLYVDRGVVPSSVWNMMVRPTTAGRFLVIGDSLLSLRIHCRTRIAHSGELHRVVQEAGQIVRSQMRDYSPVVTGLTPYFVRVERYVLTTQIVSFALAFAVIVGILGLMSRTLRTGLATVAVNLLPVLFIGGCMGCLGIPLDISTVMIATVALGTVVDDTIHLTFRYRRCRATGMSVRTALEAAFAEVGRPITTTTLVMAIGFASLIPARFGPTSYFGALSALTVIIAALADLLLLPTLILILHRGRNGKS